MSNLKAQCNFRKAPAARPNFNYPVNIELKRFTDSSQDKAPRQLGS
jgi:hypothetical protein